MSIRTEPAFRTDAGRGLNRRHRTDRVRFEVIHAEIASIDQASATADECQRQGRVVRRHHRSKRDVLISPQLNRAAGRGVASRTDDRAVPQEQFAAGACVGVRIVVSEDHDVAAA